VLVRDRIRWFSIVMLGMVGAVWMAQGLGIVRGSSFMTDDIRWTAIGAGLIAIAVVLAVIERRRQRRGA
jgi:hypothetical protein